ncbi:MAG: hypothetical protein GPOALKHO_000444 [Sodalis sp.]|nr:MAG: hypothetical protein GPOALKHO_000444 [Sodalis sp.]
MTKTTVQIGAGRRFNKRSAVLSALDYLKEFES